MIWGKRESSETSRHSASMQGPSAGTSARDLREEEVGKKMGAFC